MKVFSLLAVLLGLGVMSVFGAETPGQTAFNAKCKTCHGADGSGNPAIAKMMKVNMKALGSADVQAKSDADLKKVITDGFGKMRPVAGVNSKTADEIVQFIRTLKK